MNDREAMERAIALAWGGWGRVGSNPLVGALVLRGGKVVGEGYHAEFGGPHGEVVALRAAGKRARGADLVVTLEPCTHQGKTPPCTEAIIAAGIRRVVFAAPDADPRARGGARVLRKAGLAIEHGLLDPDVRAQNAAFFHRHAAQDRPFVAVKLAVSLDGSIADRERRSKWLTGTDARAWTHWLRAGFDAIAVGVGTVRADDPRLTVRGTLTPLAVPLRVVFDNRAETPTDATLVRELAPPVLVLAAPKAPRANVEALRLRGVDLVMAAGLRRQLRALKSRGVESLLVEGGGVLAGRLLAQGLVDRLYLITAPLLLGRDGVPAFGALRGVRLDRAKRWRTVGRKRLGADTLLVLDRP